MKLFYAGLLSVALSAPAFAGGLNEPVMEPTVTADADTTAPQDTLVSRDAIAADTAAGGSHDIIVPITALILFGISVAN
ncbi:hypothetical protein FHY55_11530 [Oceanicola sp. D3]|uniref:hypothetical protein n=1 Tax=Oceanicola sp. D3 TaxID=2587163 RepID=UPI00111D0512|nr:hypothetical protein [Oceanicola sp. D3]QDC09839.1 hypothetical protein FHY55_11530 [Oceanicola sp. D3]